MEAQLNGQLFFSSRENNLEFITKQSCKGKWLYKFLYFAQKKEVHQSSYHDVNLNAIFHFISF